MFLAFLELCRESLSLIMVHGLDGWDFDFELTPN